MKNTADIKPVAEGIRFVRKANSWLYYRQYNNTLKSDELIYCNTKESAEAKLQVK